LKNRLDPIGFSFTLSEEDNPFRAGKNYQKINKPMFDLAYIERKKIALLG